MRRTQHAFFLLVFFTPAIGYSSGLATSTNFSVMAPTRVVAEAVVKQAEYFRKEVAKEWLGKELPAGRGPTLITIVVSTTEDDGMTWPIDNPQRKFHHIWLTTSLEHAVGTTLNHEVAHTVLDSYSHPNRLPAWLREGVASQVDDSQRKEIRQCLLGQWTRDGQWPDLQAIFQLPGIGHDDRVGYTAASSVTEFLAERGGKARVIEFALSGQQHGWDRSLQDYYGVRNVAELQIAWQTWALNKVARRVREFASRD
jgi:hypothetical protein